MADPTTEPPEHEPPFDEATFNRQCGEAGDEITDLLFRFPKRVAICVLPGVLASVMKIFGIPRETIVGMLDIALKAIEDGE